MGAGAAGLAAARELLVAGHRPVVFEQGGNVGGVWAYSEVTEDHPLGLGSKHVHGSMYAGLRTNLPRCELGAVAVGREAGCRAGLRPSCHPCTAACVRLHERHPGATRLLSLAAPSFVPTGR